MKSYGHDLGNPSASNKSNGDTFGYYGGYDGQHGVPTGETSNKDAADAFLVGPLTRNATSSSQSWGAVMQSRAAPMPEQKLRPNPMPLASITRTSY